MVEGEGRLRVVVSGAGRGLGLEFTRQFLAAGDSVIACARRPDDSAELQALAEAHNDALTLARVDVTDGDLLAAAASLTGTRWDGVDVLVNNAGTYGSRDSSLESLDADELHRLIEVNTLGPLRSTRAFLRLLRRGDRPCIVNVTSLMGSIGDNTSGGSWAYRISKAALNMATRNTAHELHSYGIIAVAMHPGWVRTDMGGESAPLGVREAVESMVSTIRRLDTGDSGMFVDRDGNRLPW
jgi:NAD(P)-dependent dehydrogenase (short-subunit alcohol dehydrogenase family)